MRPFLELFLQIRPKLNTLFIYLLLSAFLLCGEINQESGKLKSPNFPNNYGNKEDCTWVINVPAGLKITLDFETPFDVSYIFV